MPSVFVYGTLRHAPLLAIVTGELPATTPARLAGHAVVQARGEDYPLLVPRPGAVATGLLVEMSDEGFARADWYETAFGYACRPCELQTDAGARTALVWLPQEAPQADDGPWSLERWQPGWAALSEIAASEAMSFFGRLTPAELGFSFTMMQMRADAHLRSHDKPRPRVTSDMTSDRVELLSSRADHIGYFTTRVDTLRHPTFAGGMSAVLKRETFIAGDAAIVLPYDPVRDRVLLVEQFRMGPYARGSRYPWMLEPVAGRVDPGETPETCARREAVEEAGLDLRDLLHVGDFYPSPGCITEYFHTYVGLCDLPDSIPGTHGVDAEGEDIRTRLLPFDAAMDLIPAGEADNGPLFLLLTWLSRERPRLRGMA